MRKVSIGSPSFSIATQPAPIQYLMAAVRELAEASHDQITEEIADAYTVTNLTETRSLDCDTATLAQLCDVVGTLINDMKKRGVKRG